MMLMLLLGRKAVSCYYDSYLIDGYSFTILERVDLKRKPAAPRGARVVSIANNAPQTMRPVPYETTI